MKRFDIIHAPLSGTNLIEASAGTGKTYTIAGLFVRLIIEKQISADRILVVTFTKAATADLKERIRDKLVETKEAFLGKPSIDRVICALEKKYKNNQGSVKLLENALIDFDKAAIFTIHGFCQRILFENAFETQNLFDTELIADQSVLIKEIAQDFWRKQFCSLPYEVLCYCIKKIPDPNHFIKFSKVIYSPDIKVVPNVSQPVLASLDPYRKTYEKLQRLWQFSRDRVCELLKDPSLSGTVYGSFKQDAVYPDHTKRDVKVFLIEDAMDRFADKNSIGYPLFKDFEKFTASKLAASVKKNQPGPLDEFFDVCDTLYDLNASFEKEMEQYLTYVKIEFFRYLKDELGVRKKNKNIQFFDDLLISVNQALGKKGSNLLLQTIREKYKAALVDEFQDTDALQCSIFERIFSSKDHGLFMIGDPKQAIYSFRGADIYSYMDAASKADSKYTLIENWRADSKMIDAVNTIYSNSSNPFIFNSILFEPQQPPACHKKTDDGYMDDPSCIIWFLPSGTYAQDKKKINKQDAVAIIAAQVADEINYLLSQNKAKESDIAVLVRTNRQALIVKAHLENKNIPSVLHNVHNVFDSHEAEQIERILCSIADSDNEKLLGAALATDIMGFTGDELYAKRSDPKFLETMFDTFQRYIHLWNTHGFIVMFRKFLSDSNVRARMLSFPDGDRRLTNLLHLSEILHQASIEKIKPADLVKWFTDQRAALSFNMEEDLLRLESDACAVQIVTIHKSKGLEYKIVFCPYAWDQSIIKEKAFMFHDSNKKQVLDLGSEQTEKNRLQAQAELLSENLRLFYVALTRAKSKCYIGWGKINSTETSALAYLFHYKDHVSDKDIVSDLKQAFAKKEDKALIDDLKQMESISKGSIKIIELPVGKNSGDFCNINEIKKPVVKKFAGVIDSTWGVSSYSSLVAAQNIDKQVSDKDTYFDLYSNITQRQADVSDKTDMFSFPKGAHAGIFFHDVFEHLDFASPDPDHKQMLVSRKLMAYGYEAKWQDAVCRMIDNILLTPFIHGGKDMMLSSVAWPERINELAFYFPLKKVSAGSIQKVFSDHGKDDVIPNFSGRKERLFLSPKTGFMKGFVDVVFRANGKYFILDWKSNFLGGNLSDYNRQAINETMVNDYYILQYHIYTLAVHKYLEKHLGSYSYKKDFGGVFYLFIRGIHPDYGTEYGIYYDCPVEDLVIELGRSFFAEDK